MKPTQPHEITDTENPTLTIATVHPATASYITKVLKAEEGHVDGRSEWLWLRLSDGTLMLGLFPRGDTYLECEIDASYPG